MGFSLSDLDPTNWSVGGTRPFAPRNIDVTSAASPIGRMIGARGRELVRQSVGTSLAGLTGGASMLTRRGRETAIRGYQTGARVGLGVVTGQVTDVRTAFRAGMPGIDAGARAAEGRQSVGQTPDPGAAGAQPRPPPKTPGWLVPVAAILAASTL